LKQLIRRVLGSDLETGNNIIRVNNSLKILVHIAGPDPKCTLNITICGTAVPDVMNNDLLRFFVKLYADHFCGGGVSWN